MSNVQIKTPAKPLDAAMIMAIREEYVLDCDEICVDPEREADEAASRIIAEIDKARLISK